MENTKEKRKLVRFKAPFYVKYTQFDSSQGLSAIAKDISMQGMRILVDNVLGLKGQDVVCISFILPGQTLQICGKVVWVGEYNDRIEAGVLFLNISDGCKQSILDYVFKYFPQELTRRWWQGTV